MAADVIGDESETTRDDYEASEDDNVLVQGVAGTEGAIGYFGYTYYEENADSLKAVADRRRQRLRRALGRDRPGRRVHPAVAPAVHLRQATPRTTTTRPSTEYVDFYIENLADIAEAGKFIPLSDDQYARRSRRSTALARLTAPPA